MFLYSTGKDPSKEKWDGASTRFEDVVALFGADDARPLENVTDDLRALAARAEHVYVDVPKPARHRLYRLHRQHRRAASGTTGLLKYYLSRRQRASDDDDNDNVETGPGSEVASYMDVVPASKYRPLAPLVGKLRSVKSAFEIEVMKASAEISARAHAKVSESFCPLLGLGYGRNLCTADAGERN
jgi:intermediate cleaving peptidase 55